MVSHQGQPYSINANPVHYYVLWVGIEGLGLSCKSISVLPVCKEEKDVATEDACSFVPHR